MRMISTDVNLTQDRFDKDQLRVFSEADKAAGSSVFDGDEGSKMETELAVSSLKFCGSDGKDVSEAIGCDKLSVDGSDDSTAPVETPDNSENADQGDQETTGLTSTDNDDDYSVGAVVPGTRSSKVRFTTIEVREYPIIVGDNPGSLRGTPVTIDWQHDESTSVTVEVDDYESTRPERRAMTGLSMPSSVREDLLRRCGFSRKEIMEGLREANLVRGKRQKTKETMGLAPAEELLQRMVKKMLNLTIYRKKKKEEKKMLREFVGTYLTLNQRNEGR